MNECPTLRDSDAASMKDVWSEYTHANTSRFVLNNPGRQQQAEKAAYICAFADTQTMEHSGFDAVIELTDGTSVRISIREMPMAPRMWMFDQIHGPRLLHYIAPKRLSEGASGTNNPMAPLLRQIAGLEKQNLNAALNVLYRNILSTIKTGGYGDIDQLLASVDVKQASVHLLLGLLTATLAVRIKLPSRKDFFRRAKAELKTRKEWSPNLISGLEG